MVRTRLNAEWIDYMKAYRLYIPTQVYQTSAYVEDLEEAKRLYPEYEIVEVDIATMHVECF
jgi:hypothetical protein